jgi:hypothetical protein
MNGSFMRHELVSPGRGSLPHELEALVRVDVVHQVALRAVVHLDPGRLDYQPLLLVQSPLMASVK